MKFRNYLETIAGVEIFPLISLLIFFVFFVGLLVYVVRLDKKSVNGMKNIPLNDGSLKKGILSLILFTFISSSAFAQGQQEEVRALSGTDLLLLLLLGMLFFVAVLVIILLVNAFSVLRQINNNIPEKASKSILDAGWWKKFGGVGVSLHEEKHILIEGHDYDGIQELDNRMPPWLQSLFVSTVIIAIIYSAYYFGGFGDFQMAELDKEIAQAEVEKKAYLAKVGSSMDENTVTILTEEEGINQGKALFQEKCTACHGADAGGSVGPNLTDQYWLHSGGVKNIFKVIKYGVPEKGMISWEKQLSPMDIQKVASYVLSLKGTKPANPKEPQGDLFEEGNAAGDSAVALN
ncbi:c-type cytochrome [Dyadobacter sp. CY345]|uniref:c-type cytochrome n=1 Tax=Dyadobacter sp. CY345 TaxID=2909335 RepID=UPI001F35E7A5|nr:c-type cytochrome [Dyadobacter sp. CY345]MCF2444769.1 c-type cytochrome [Dyadobacter sp. CY345]